VVFTSVGAPGGVLDIVVAAVFSPHPPATSAIATRRTATPVRTGPATLALDMSDSQNVAPYGSFGCSSPSVKGINRCAYTSHQASTCLPP